MQSQEDYPVLDYRGETNDFLIELMSSLNGAFMRFPYAHALNGVNLIADVSGSTATIHDLAGKGRSDPVFKALFHLNSVVIGCYAYHNLLVWVMPNAMAPYSHGVAAIAAVPPAIAVMRDAQLRYRRHQEVLDIEELSEKASIGLARELIGMVHDPSMTAKQKARALADSFNIELEEGGYAEEKSLYVLGAEVVENITKAGVFNLLFNQARQPVNGFLCLFTTLFLYRKVLTQSTTRLRQQGFYQLFKLAFLLCWVMQIWLVLESAVLGKANPGWDARGMLAGFTVVGMDLTCRRWVQRDVQEQASDEQLPSNKDDGTEESKQEEAMPSAFVQRMETLSVHVEVGYSRILSVGPWCARQCVGLFAGKREGQVSDTADPQTQTDTQVISMKQADLEVLGTFLRKMRDDLLKKPEPRGAIKQFKAKIENEGIEEILDRLESILFRPRSPSSRVSQRPTQQNDNMPVSDVPPEEAHNLPSPSLQEG